MKMTKGTPLTKAKKMSDARYSIGQVVYVVMNKKNQVYPMMIVEVITKRTLEGETTQYLLQAGADSSSTIMMDKLDGEIFISPESVVETLTQRFTSQIRRIVQGASTKATEWYGSSLVDQQQNDSKPISVQAQTSHASENTDVVPVIMPDGTLAKIKLPNTTSLEDVI